MKRIISIIFISFSISSFAQAFEKNELIVEVGMGFPNLSYFRSNTNNFGHFSGFGVINQDIHKSRGQFIASSEFLMTQKVGFELGIHYGNYYDYSTSTQQVSTQYGTTTQTYYYEQKTNRIRVYLGMNFHVIRSERLDSYIGAKVGFKKSFIDYNSNDPADINNSFQYEIPFGLRISYGFRYFINEYWGLHTEFGLGGPLVTFGLTHKLID